MEKSQSALKAEQVREILSRFMLADGLDLVADLERSSGCRLFDAKRGAFFLDFFSFYATLPLGFNHPRLVHPDTIAHLGRVAAHKPSNSDVYTPEMARFVATFGRLALPPHMKYMFFVEGGTLAVENALKAAFDWKARKNLARGLEPERPYQVIHFREAFHGRSGYTLSLTNTADPRKIQYFPKFPWPRIVNPKCHFPLEGENLQRTLRTEEEALGQIRQAIEAHPHEVACLVLEPIQSEGGDNHFRPEFHRELRRICDEHELLLIYDEVQTGFGGTGKMWAFEHYVRPDLLAFGKKTQVCGVLAGERLDEVPDNVFHVSSRINSTWGGNLVDMARCRIYLEIYEEERILEHAARMGSLLLRELENLQQEFSLVSNARGKGLLCAFDLPSRELRDQVRRRLFEKRLLILPCGERSLRFRTALNISEEDLREGLAVLRKVLEEVSVRADSP